MAGGILAGPRPGIGAAAASRNGPPVTRGDRVSEPPSRGNGVQKDRDAPGPAQELGLREEWEVDREFEGGPSGE